MTTQMMQTLRSRIAYAGRVSSAARRLVGRRILTSSLAPLTLLAVAACGSDTITENASTSPTQALGVLVAAPGAVLIAVGDSLQMGARAYSLAGDVLQPDSMRYVIDAAADSAYVKISPAGMLTAIKVKPSTVTLDVVAFKNGTARMDQAFILVTATSVAGVTLSVQPVPPDSARLDMGMVKKLVPVVKNPTTSVSVANSPVQLSVSSADAQRVAFYAPRSFNPNVPSVAYGSALLYSAGTFSPLVGQGTAWIYGSLTAYGVALRDSVQYTFSYRHSLTIDASKYNLALVSSMSGETITLGQGAVVQFDNDVAYGDPLSITYTLNNSAAASGYGGDSGGDPGTLTSGTSALRQFNTPGTYVWTGIGSGGPAPWPGQKISGTIIIK